MIAPSQAWAALARHAADDVRSLRLSELRGNLTDEEVGSFVEVHRSSADAGSDGNADHTLLLDFSRQRMTLETMHHLLRLSAAKETKGRIRDLAWGRLAPGSKLRRRGYRDEGLAAPTVSFAGDGNPNYPNNRGVGDDAEEEEGGSMHMALRAPASQGLMMRDPYANDKSKNALDEIHADWERMRSLSDAIRQGTRRGAAGKPLCDVLVVSAGSTVVPRALEFVYRALLHDPAAGNAACVDSSLISLKTTTGGGSGAPSHSKSVLDMVTTPFKSRSQSGARGAAAHSASHRRRKLRMLTSTDPGALADAVAELSPATTIVVELQVDGTREKERREISSAVKEWLLLGLAGASTGGSDGKEREEDILSKHTLVVSGDRCATGTKSNSFLFPRHSRCEAFGTLSAAGLLPISVIFGWTVANSFIHGAHDMDCHFVDANPRHSLPILLALVDLWNDSFLLTKGRAVSPYTAALGSYPGFVAALENCALSGSGRESTLAHKTGVATKQGPSPVIDGRDQTLSSTCPQALSAEFLMAMEDTSGSTVSNHETRVCSLLAHADTLAFGSTEGNNRGRFDMSSPGSPPIQSVDSMISHGSVNFGSDGATLQSNQISTLLLCGACDAFTCGQLVALAEHRALVKAWLWDVDPFKATTSLSTEDDRRESITKRLHEIHLGEMDETSRDNDNPTGCKMSVFTGTNAVLRHVAHVASTSR